jgi:hypothetical protein
MAAMTTTTICSLFAPMMSAVSSMVVCAACIPWLASCPLP